jgi:outer membrane protein OmpA-like peptidoglycan-associated protein
MKRGERSMNMSPMRSRLLAGAVFVAAAMTAGAGAAQAACADLIAAFDRAIAARQMDTAASIFDEIGGNNAPACNGSHARHLSRYADFLLDYANMPSLAPKLRDDAVTKAGHLLLTSGYWKGKSRLADYYFTHGDKPAAHEWYKLSAAALATKGTDPATDRERQVLLIRLAASKSLANDDEGGQKAPDVSVSERGPDGKLGGIFSDALLVRGTGVVSVPIPINFMFNQATFTPLGEQAMKELIDAAREAPAMTLVGHADPRGTAEYNMALSRDRVMAVRERLIREGVKARITVQWKGASQPFDTGTLPDPGALTQEEIWQLDRRVEWVRDAVRE